MPLEVSSLLEVLELRAADTPDHLAFDVCGERLTWGGLFEGARRAAAALRAVGAVPGAPCAIVLPTSVEFLWALFGAQMIGAVPVAINPKFSLSQVCRRVGELACPVVVATPAVAQAALDGAPFGPVPVMSAQVLRAASPLSRRDFYPPDPGGLSHLQLTSGTTGAPRAAMLRHSNVAAAMTNALELLDPVPEDVFVGWLPLHHDFGLVRFVFEAMYLGCTSHLIEPSMSTLPTWLETISRVGGTITGAPDFVFRLAGRLVPGDRVNLKSLRIATNGGEAVRMTSIRTFEDHFAVPGVVMPAYGLAEATLGVSTLRAGESVEVDESGAVSCGRPALGLDVRIVDDAGRTLGSGQRGRIVVRGNAVFAGYLDDAASTADVLRDGWLETGDLGALGHRGQLFVHGRTRAMIKRAGAAIAPREIEEIADEIHGVRRSAAIGISPGPDALTEEVCVVVEVERSVDDRGRAVLRTSVSDLVRAALGFAPYDVRLVAPGTIPRTPTGKTQYSELRRQMEGDRALFHRNG